MIIVMSLTTLVLLTVTILTYRKYREATMQLFEPRGLVKTAPVQIICGDCSGENDTPVRTFLSDHGNCLKCGGYSYVLASTLATNSMVHQVAKRLSENETRIPIGGSVISLEHHLATRAGRMTKLAS
jgi:hypothetical protein